MVAFLGDLHRAANVRRTLGAAGGPWEFNLRDLLRWCQLAEGAVPSGAALAAEAASQVRSKSCLVPFRRRLCRSMFLSDQCRTALLCVFTLLKTHRHQFWSVASTAIYGYDLL